MPVLNKNAIRGEQGRIRSRREPLSGETQPREQTEETQAREQTEGHDQDVEKVDVVDWAAIEAEVVTPLAGDELPDDDGDQGRVDQSERGPTGIFAPLRRRASAVVTSFKRTAESLSSHSGDVAFGFGEGGNRGPPLFAVLSRRASTRPYTRSLSRAESAHLNASAYSRTGFECEIPFEGCKQAIADVLDRKGVEYAWRNRAFRTQVRLRPSSPPTDIQIFVSSLSESKSRVDFAISSKKNRSHTSYWQLVDWYRDFLRDFRRRNPSSLPSRPPTLREQQMNDRIP